MPQPQVPARSSVWRIPRLRARNKKIPALVAYQRSSCSQIRFHKLDTGRRLQKPPFLGCRHIRGKFSEKVSCWRRQGQNARPWDHFRGSACLLTLGNHLGLPPNGPQYHPTLTECVELRASEWGGLPVCPGWTWRTEGARPHLPRLRCAAAMRVCARLDLRIYPSGSG